MTLRSVKVKSIRVVEKPTLVGDIGVLKNHNLFVSRNLTLPSVLVHNCWSFAAQDFKLGNLFKVGRNLRAKYFRTGDKAVNDEIQLKGDIHKINCTIFFGVNITEVTSDLRNAVKAIVFGAIYGRSVESIARVTGRDVPETRRVYDGFFKRYHVARAWLDWAVDTARKYLHTHSFIGRKRNLFGYLTGVKYLMAAMDRRAMNSPIQGVAADIVHTSAWLFMNAVYDTLLDLEYFELDDYGLPTYKGERMTDLPFGIEAMVHDSSRMEVHFRFLLIALQIFQYCFTTGAEKYYNRVFDVKFTVPTEVEIEIGFADSHMHKWDFSIPHLRECIRLSLEDRKKELGEEFDVDKALAFIWKPWDTPRIKDYLDKNYPFFENADYD
jgi:hypothetical protein